jgi:hypothetical protein
MIDFKNRPKLAVREGGWQIFIFYEFYVIRRIFKKIKVDLLLLTVCWTEFRKKVVEIRKKPKNLPFLTEN